MIKLERSISKTLSDGLTIKEFQPGRDTKMFQILLIHHQVLKCVRIPTIIVLTDSHKTLILEISVKEIVLGGLGVFKAFMSTTCMRNN